MAAFIASTAVAAFFATAAVAALSDQMSANAAEFFLVVVAAGLCLLTLIGQCNGAEYESESDNN